MKNSEDSDQASRTYRQIERENGFNHYAAAEQETPLNLARPKPLKPIDFEERLKNICIRFLPYSYYELDRKLEPFLQTTMSADAFSWLRKARVTLQLTTRTVAERAGVSHNSYVQTERAEREGAVTLESMQIFAEAMGCEFVYAVRPKDRKSFTSQIWRQIRVDAEKKINQRRYFDEDSRYRVLGQMMGRYFQVAKFRRKYGWSERYPRVN